jgi:hypothetical protein
MQLRLRLHKKIMVFVFFNILPADNKKAAVYTAA